jgi:cytoskeleton-associated protein 5
MHPATPTDVVMRPPTPVSAELKSELAGVFKMIGEKTSTIQGLERLFDFSRAHPGVDIQPHLARTSVAFQNYIKKGLSKVEVARAEKAATHPQGPFEAGASDSGAGGTVAAARRGAPLVAPSPMPQMEKSAAEVYRERLARMQATKETGVSTASGMGAGSSARVAARVPARAASAGAGARSGSSAASAGLTTLRERMDRIAAKAAGAGPAGGAGAAGGSLGNGSNGSGGGIGSGSPRVPRRMVDVNQVEVLQARMERIKAGRVEGGTQG